MSAKFRTTWTAEQDKRLIQLREEGKNWNEISRDIGFINIVCANRHIKLLKEKAERVEANNPLITSCINYLRRYTLPVYNLGSDSYQVGRFKMSAAELIAEAKRVRNYKRILQPEFNHVIEGLDDGE